MSLLQDLLDCYERADVEAAEAIINGQDSLSVELSALRGAVHPIVKSFVDGNGGHCYKPEHLQISDMLTPVQVRAFREAVLSDRCDEVRDCLQQDSELVHSEFAAGRGIAKAIHHWNSVAVGKLLVDAGAELHSLNSLGESPLTMQMRFGEPQTVAFLLEAGVDPNVGKGGHMPSKHFDEMVNLLLKYGWDVNHGEMLHDAKHGFGKRVQKWLMYGFDPNAQDQFGNRALHYFAKKGTGAETIRALVESGGEIDSKNAKGETPLSLARSAARQTAFHELQKLGAKS